MGELVVVEVNTPDSIVFRNGDVMLFASGMQGTPGVPQIYDQLTAPAAIQGYTLLWFHPPTVPTGDPNDREINLVVYP